LHAFDATYLDSCRTHLASEQAKSLAETNNWQHVNKPKVHSDWEILYREIAAAIDNISPEGQRGQLFIQRHFEIACRFYTPSKEAYIGLALYYQENVDMRNYHNAYHPRMVEFLSEAIAFYANRNL